jgi:hypothetical protein
MEGQIALMRKYPKATIQNCLDRYFCNFGGPDFRSLEGRVSAIAAKIIRREDIGSEPRSFAPYRYVSLHAYSRCTKSRMVEIVRGNFNGTPADLEGHKSKNRYGADDVRWRNHILPSPAAMLILTLQTLIKNSPTRQAVHVKQCSFVTFSKRWYGPSNKSNSDWEVERVGI